MAHICVCRAVARADVRPGRAPQAGRHAAVRNTPSVTPPTQAHPTPHTLNTAHPRPEPLSARCHWGRP
eukprot:5145796-Pyramimonas_sp.AAC.1